MKKFFIISIIFLMTSVFMTAVFAGMAGEQGMKNYFVNVLQERMNCVDANLVQSKIPLMGADEISLESVSTDIKFEPSGSGDIEVEYAAGVSEQEADQRQIFSRSGKIIKFDVSEFVAKNEQNLKFNLDTSRGWDLHFENLALLVRVPKQIKKIKINSTSGDVKIVQLNFDQVVVDTVSADVRFKDSKVNDLKFQTYSGDFKFSGSLANIEASSISGSLKFELNNNDTVAKIQTTSGDVKAKMKQKNGSWDVQTVSGSYRIVENENFENDIHEKYENDIHDKHEKELETRLNTYNKIKKCSDFNIFGVNFN
jgi:hypothetical protein